jgi:magnesium transporter
MRDMLLATPDTQLDALMIRDPFAFREGTSLEEALKTAAAKHFPVYPVCDNAGVLTGLIRGDELFRNQAIEISAQAGKMVGVEKEERLTTPISRSLKLRHPWLQINLLTACRGGGGRPVREHAAAAGHPAVFLPVMAGQTGNTGCRAAVTLSMTLASSAGWSAAGQQGLPAFQRRARRHQRRAHGLLRYGQGGVGDQGPGRAGRMSVSCVAGVAGALIRSPSNASAPTPPLPPASSHHRQRRGEHGHLLSLATLLFLY